MRHKQRLLRAATAAAAILAPTLYLCALFPRSLIFLDTTAAGGDLGSHNYVAHVTRTLLWTRHQLTGWVPGNYCGFPLFQMYFPLPFVGIALASAVVEPNVAFKLASIAGVIALPGAAYFLLHRLRTPFPGPEIGASVTLLFLLQTGNSMWGGNLASTLAGEFTYSISLPMALVILAIYRDLLDAKAPIVIGAILIAILAMTHAYTVLWVATACGLFLLGRREFVASATRYVLIFVWGGALCAFWLLPMVWYAPWTTAFSHAWLFASILEVVPPTMLPIWLVAIVAPVVIRAQGREQWRGYWNTASLLYAGVAAGALAYAAGPNLGIVDVRFLPFVQVSLTLLAAAAAGHLLRDVPAAGLWIPIAFVGCILAVEQDRIRMGEWIRWNYEGFERKAAWPIYSRIIDELRASGSTSRVVYEHTPENEALGTVRAFENLPLFAGRATLEGVNLQASVTSPFVFYVQSEISQVMSCPFAAYGCSRFNLGGGVEHLKMMNVTDLILRRTETKQAARRLGSLVYTASVGPYELYRIRNADAGYAIQLGASPRVVVTDDWKSASYRWFKYARPADPVPVWLKRSERYSEDSTVPAFATTGIGQALNRPVGEAVEDERMVLSGLTVGVPVLIRVSYHPRWRATTGERVWLAGPGFMLVIPTRDTLTLVYDESVVTRSGVVISGLALTAALVCLVALRRRVVDDTANGVPRTRGHDRGEPHVNVSATHRPALVGCIVCALFGTAIVGRLQNEDADATYRNGQLQLDRGDMDAARRSFARARVLAPLSNTAIHSSYADAIVLYRQERWKEAAARFQRLLVEFPEAQAAAESMYHIGLCANRLGEREEARRVMARVRSDFPDTPWAGYATDRLSEWDAAQ